MPASGGLFLMITESPGRIGAARSWCSRLGILLGRPKPVSYEDALSSMHLSLTYSTAYWSPRCFFCIGAANAPLFLDGSIISIANAFVNRKLKPPLYILSENQAQINPDREKILTSRHSPKRVL